MVGFTQKSKTVAASPYAAEWAAYEAKGMDAIDGLIEAYMPLMHRAVERISMRLPSHIAIEDLAQVALVGLYKAIVSFKADRGVPFEGYAYPRIRGVILDELRSNDHLSRGKRHQVNQVERVVAEWMQQYGEMPSEEDIAAQLNMSLESFNHLMDDAKPLCSLDAGEPGNLSLHETIADPNGSSEEEAQRHDMQQLLREGFRHLNPREQRILYLYYFEELRLSEIAVLFNLTEARISQIHALSVVRLRSALVNTFPTAFCA